MQETVLQHGVAFYRHCFFGLVVLDQVDADHQSQAPHVADQWVPRRQLSQLTQDVIPHVDRILHQPLFDQRDRLERGHASDRVTAERAGVRAFFPVHDFGLGDHGPQRQPRCQPLGGTHDVGLDAPVVDGPHLARAADARLHFVGDVQNAMPFGQRLKLAVILGRGHDVAPFSLNRFDDDRCDFLGGDRGLEQFFLEIGDAFDPASAVREVARAAITIAVTDVRHFGKQRLEPAALSHFAGGEREGPHRASVKGAVESNDMLPASVITGEFNGRFDRLGPRIGEQHPLGRFPGSDLAQLFCQIAQRRIIKIGPADMDQFGGLVLNGLHHTRMAVPGRADGDSGGEVEEQVAIHVLEHQAVAAFDGQRIRPRVRRRDELFVDGDQFERDRSRGGSSDVRRCGRCERHVGASCFRKFGTAVFFQLYQRDRKCRTPHAVHSSQLGLRRKSNFSHGLNTDKTRI